MTLIIKNKKLDDIQKLIISDVKDMINFIKDYSIKKNGIQPDLYILKIIEKIEDTILIPAEIKFIENGKL